MVGSTLFVTVDGEQGTVKLKGMTMMMMVVKMVEIPIVVDIVSIAGQIVRAVYVIVPHYNMDVVGVYCLCLVLCVCTFLVKFIVRTPPAKVFTIARVGEL